MKDPLILLLEELIEKTNNGEITGLIYSAKTPGLGYMIGFEGSIEGEDLYLATEEIGRLAKIELQEEANTLLNDNGAGRLVRGT